MSERTMGPLLEGLATRRIHVESKEVVFVKGIIEASEGLAGVFADAGGDLTIATLPERLKELDELLVDLQKETGALLSFDMEDDGR